MVKSSENPFEAFLKFAHRKIKGRGMGISDDDMAIYDTDNWVKKHKNDRHKANLKK